MADTTQRDDNDDSHDVVRLWFLITMASTAIFLLAVFLFII